MNTEKITENKEPYIQPVLVTHELLRDITAKKSGGIGNLGIGHLLRQHHHHNK